MDFDTTRAVYPTRPDKSHINYVVADTESWEQKLAQAVEGMDEVLCYARNDHLGFTISYTFNGEEHNYTPDFLVRIKDARIKDARVDDAGGPTDPLNLILEVSGQKRSEKAAKAATARNLWVPAINNHGGFGRWAYLEITDPWNAQNAIRAALSSTV